MNLNSNILSLTAAVALAAACGNAEARQCFDFSNMDEDVSYTVGDVIETDIAKISVKPYVVDGEPATAATRGAERAQSQIAGGAAPELELKLVALVIKPNKPVTSITTRIAQNISSSGGFANSGVAVNRRGMKSETGFAGTDGKVLGTPSTGTARISADVSPTGSGNWHSGTLEFNSVKGKISSIRLGGHTWRLDDMCFLP